MVAHAEGRDGTRNGQSHVSNMRGGTAAAGEPCQYERNASQSYSPQCDHSIHSLKIGHQLRRRYGRFVSSSSDCVPAIHQTSRDSHIILRGAKECGVHVIHLHRAKREARRNVQIQTAAEHYRARGVALTGSHPNKAPGVAEKRMSKEQHTATRIKELRTHREIAQV